jgi:hypothetical protein
LGHKKTSAPFASAGGSCNLAARAAIGICRSPIIPCQRCR